MAWWQIDKPGDPLHGALIEAPLWFDARVLAMRMLGCEAREVQLHSVEREIAGWQRIVQVSPTLGTAMAITQKMEKKRHGTRKPDRPRRHRR